MIGMVPREELVKWFDAGKDHDYAYMILLFDLMREEVTPEYVPEEEDIREWVRGYQREKAERAIDVLGCYNLNKKLENQLDQEFNW